MLILCLFIVFIGIVLMIFVKSIYQLYVYPCFIHYVHEHIH